MISPGESSEPAAVEVGHQTEDDDVAGSAARYFVTPYAGQIGYALCVWRAVWFALVGCGRIAFDPTGPSPLDAPGADVAPLFDPSACPATYSMSVPSTLSRYRLVLTGTDWLTANSDCVDDQIQPAGFTHLAVIGSEPERLELEAMFAEDPWIGMSDRLVESSFLPITLEDIGTYAAPGSSAWHPGEPNEQGGEDCLHLKTEGGLNDVGCTTFHFHLCECDAYANTSSRY